MARLQIFAFDRSLDQQLRGAFTSFGALVAAGFFVTAMVYGICWGWLEPQSARCLAAVRAEGAADAAMIDEENGLRGYLLTLDVRFLAPYVDGRAKLARANDELGRFAEYAPDLGAAMLDVRLAEELWTARWADAAAELRPGAAAPPMLEGKRLFDAYRSKEQVFRDALDERAETSSGRDREATAVRVGLDLMVFLVVFLLAVRQHGALRESIVAPVAAILRHIGRVRDGDLNVTVDPAGPRELRELGEGLNDMVRSLALAREAAGTRDDAVRSQSIRLRQILDASREFSESLNLKYVVTAVRESTALVGGYDRVTVWLMAEGGQGLTDAQDQSGETVAQDGPKLGKGLAGRAAKAGRVTFEGPTGQVRFGEDNAGPVRAIAVPLIVGARVVGVLEARWNEARIATRPNIDILEMLATHAATAVESARLHEIAEERSQMDALTRLSNRRRLDEDLEAECKRSLRYGRPLALVMVDVDHFKAFNDTHGHPKADTALQGVAGVLAGCARTTDTAYRYGGEEFCILLRETTAADAMHCAERMRLRIEERFATAGPPGITASFGVAEFQPTAPLPRSLVEAADSAMYESKRAGRNRVILSVPPPPPLGTLAGAAEPSLV